MVKSELITVMQRSLSLPKSVVDDVIDACFREIEGNLLKGNKIMLTGFGRFDTRVREARRFYSPLTRRRFELPSMVIPVFRFSPVLTSKVKRHFN
jgi:nucleoid DNA-binding protein